MLVSYIGIYLAKLWAKLGAQAHVLALSFGHSSGDYYLTIGLWEIQAFILDTYFNFDFVGHFLR